MDTTYLAGGACCDPAATGDPVPDILYFQVYQSLLRNNPSDLTKPYPSIASSYTESSDAKVFTFKLNPLAKFSDGTAVTADDVVFSLLRNEYLNGAGNWIPPGTTVSAPDPETVVVSLTVGDPAFPWKVANVTSAILNSKVLKQHGGTDAVDASTTDTAGSYLLNNSAGSGPYQIESINLQSQYVIRANPNYWGSKPYYTRVILREVSPAVQAIEIQSGAAQMAWQVPPGQVPSLGGNVNVYRLLTPHFAYLSLNGDPKISPLTANPDFRQAIAEGIDYAGLLSLIPPSGPMTGFRPQGFPGALPISQAPTRDLALAKAALARTNFKNPTIDLTYVTNQNPFGYSWDPIAQKIQSDLKEVGITVNLVSSPPAVVLPKLRAGQLAFWMVIVTADLPDLSDGNVFLPGGSMAARVHWAPGQIPQADALISQIPTTLDEAQRIQLYEQIQVQVNDTHYYVFLDQWALTIVAAKSVHNVTLDPIRTMYFADLN